MALVALLVTSTAVFAQATAPRRSVARSRTRSGGVLPGATVTITNVGTKAVATSVTDGRGGYQAVVFPGTYDLKVELEGFKTYEQKGIAISPSDTRGIDIKLEVGAQTETVTVTAQTEVIQTETGAREGVLTAAQIDNLSIIGRSSLELLRILPGVVAPDSSAFESVSFGGGANNTQGYTVNGIRGSNNTVSLDGSSLIDIGSNSGVIVDAEQRHGAGGQGPELQLRRRVRHRRHERQRGHQGRQLQVQRHRLRLHPQLQVRGQRPLEQHRRRREAEEHLQLSGRQRRRPDSALRARTSTANRTSCSSSSASKCSGRRSTQARASASCRR